MALTGRVVFSSYSFTSGSDRNSGVMGTSRNFPSSMTDISAAPSGTVGGPSNNITLLSVVRILPTGLNQKSGMYYTADSPTTLNTNGS